MLALSVVLTQVTQLPLPFGGSVTLFGQLPILIISYRYSVRHGLLTSFAMGLIQLAFGWSNTAYIARTFHAYVIFILFDYIIAFGVLGLGGMFRGKIKSQAGALALGGAVVSVLRYLCHFISGVTIWGDYAEGSSVLIYSLTYNASYMVPELLITVIGAVLISAFLDFSRRDLIRRRGGESNPSDQ